MDSYIHAAYITSVSKLVRGEIVFYLSESFLKASEVDESLLCCTFYIRAKFMTIAAHNRCCKLGENGIRKD